MRWIVRVLGGLVGLVVILAAVAYLLPRSVTVARTVVIDAPADAIWPHVSSLQAMEVWSPWMGIDPNVQVTHSGPESGVGARMEWASDNPDVGTGTQEIIAATEMERILTALNFGDMGLAQAEILLSPSGRATEVTWGLEADMGMSPVSRWMGLMMDRWVGADYEKGLGNLKTLIEAG